MTATFRPGGQTHPTVPVQQSALELVAADCPGTRDETGTEEHRRAVPGAEHVPGETGTAAPGGTGATPGPAEVGEQGGKAHTGRSEPYVFALGRERIPVQPCAAAFQSTRWALGCALDQRLPGASRFCGFQNGDPVGAAVPSGTRAGARTAGMAVRGPGSFNTAAAQDSGHKYLRLLQRADG